MGAVMHIVDEDVDVLYAALIGLALAAHDSDPVVPEALHYIYALLCLFTERKEQIESY